MKVKIWNTIVLTVVVLSVGSFLFLFVEDRVEPRLESVPFIFWTGLVVAILLVGLTFLASIFFPYKESKDA
jgi:heme/copper-type cytochrome/quinol oxidase subunit 4